MKKLLFILCFMFGLFVGIVNSETIITLKSGKTIVINEPIISIVFEGVVSKSSTMNKTPDGAIQLLFKHVKAGQ
nr:hypothetical protein [Bacteroidota bacterium]